MMIYYHCVNKYSFDENKLALYVNTNAMIIHVLPKGTVINVPWGAENVDDKVVIIGAPKVFPSYAAICGRCEQVVIGGNLGMVEFTEKADWDVNYLTLKKGGYKWARNTVDYAIKDGVLITHAVVWCSDDRFTPTVLFDVEPSDEYKGFPDEEEKEVVQSLIADSALMGYYLTYSGKKMLFRGAICRAKIVDSEGWRYNAGAILTASKAERGVAYDFVPVPAYCGEPYTLVIFPEKDVSLGEFERASGVPEPHLVEATSTIDNTFVVYNPLHYASESMRPYVEVKGEKVYLPTYDELRSMYGKGVDV